MQQLFLYIFSAPTSWGTRTAAGVFAPDGAAAFSAPAERGTRTASAGSPLTGGFFSAPAERGTRTALACSPLTGGKFSAEPQRGDSPSADGGNVAAPAAGAKRKDNLRFSFLFELLPFPCFLIWRRLPTCDRFETGERQSSYRSVSFATCSQFTNSVLLHMWLNQRRRDITVSRNTLACCNARHLRIKHLVQFILVGAVYHNALTNCAARLCRACWK